MNSKKCIVFIRFKYKNKLASTKMNDVLGKMFYLRTFDGASFSITDNRALASIVGSRKDANYVVKALKNVLKSKHSIQKYASAYEYEFIINCGYEPYDVVIDIIDI